MLRLGYLQWALASLGGSRARPLALAMLCGCGSSSAGASMATPEAGPPGTIYVTMYGDNEITAYDQSTHALLAHIPVGKGPAVLLATPDGKKLYTANWSDNTISAVTIATSRATSIPLAGRPWAIAMSPAGDTLWAGLASDALVAVDTTTDTIVATYDTSPTYPESVIVSKDGTQLYVAPTNPSSLLSGTLEALSTTDGSIVHPPIPVGETPAWASISPDGTRAYTLNFLAGSVSVVDTASWQVVATVASGSQPIISSSTPQGLLVVTNFGSGNLVTVDFTTNKIAHTLGLDGRPVGVGGYNADGTLGYVVDFGHASLAMQETTTEALSFLEGDLTPFIGNDPGHLTAFNPETGEEIGESMTVGKGPTSVVVVSP